MAPENNCSAGWLGSSFHRSPAAPSTSAHFDLQHNLLDNYFGIGGYYFTFGYSIRAKVYRRGVPSQEGPRYSIISKRSNLFCSKRIPASGQPLAEMRVRCKIQTLGSCADIPRVVSQLPNVSAMPRRKTDNSAIEPLGRMADIRQLEAFHAILQTGSMSSAASLLGITQPAVSALLARMEKQVALTLFTRQGRRLVPTAEAEQIFGEVSEALAALERVGNAFHSLKHAYAGTLTIAAHPTASIYWLPPILARFQARRPDVIVRVVSRSSEALRSSAGNDAFDIGIAETAPDWPKVRAQRFRSRCVVAMRPDHPLAQKKTITPHDLDGQRFVALTRWQSTFHHVKAAFEDASARWDVVAECEYFATAFALVAAGTGVTIAEPVSAQAEEESGRVILREFKPDIRYDFALFHPGGRPASIISREFIDDIKAALRRFITP